ncbi:hypothetical protein [Faecalibacter macacae]|uniref:Periplasmic heavy metal sensor n=1 Tax=Faecalibacter macacae TaxID=1859289 RepID=A0A3L9MGN5_9FLAO|nr:hypothetical protein [Faecalibacter macacae]RLZ11925.1 hypothetical protein EAH69_03105 [Faecalibacter macacae]
MNLSLKNIAIIALFATSITAFGQTNQTKEQKYERFKKEMDLTDAQVLKIKAIKDKYNPEKAELKRKLDELRKRELEEIDDIYTPEQKVKLKAIIEKHKAQKK